MLDCLSATLLVTALTSAAPSDDGRNERLVLWYDKPAAEWMEALPVGNGRLGAMVFGGVDSERIQLNEESMWAGPPVPENPDGLASPLAEAREMLYEGQPAEAERVVAEKILAPRISPRSHQTLGDLHLRMVYPGRELAAPLAVSSWRRGPSLKQTDDRQLAADFDDSAWPVVAGEQGRVTGLCARGGFSVDIAWSQGRLTRATIRSRSARPCRVRYGKCVISRDVPADGAIEVQARDLAAPGN